VDVVVSEADEVAVAVGGRLHPLTHPLPVNSTKNSTPVLTIMARMQGESQKARARQTIVRMELLQLELEQPPVAVNFLMSRILSAVTSKMSSRLVAVVASVDDAVEEPDEVAVAVGCTPKNPLPVNSTTTSNLRLVAEVASVGDAVEEPDEVVVAVGCILKNPQPVNSTTTSNLKLVAVVASVDDAVEELDEVAVAVG